MSYKLVITMTDADYLAFNRFHMLRSPYGKKTMRSLRLSVAFLFLAIAFLSLILEDFSREALFMAGVFLLILLVFELSMNRFFLFILHRQIKNMKKSGKPGYTPHAEMTFTEQSFTEESETGKTELRYDVIERVSIIESGAVYLHTNSLLAYVLPYRAFSSEAERESLIAFLKERCPGAAFAEYPR